MNAPANRAALRPVHRMQNIPKRTFWRGAFVDNQRLTIDLPRDFDLATLGIRVTGTAAVTVAGTAVRAEAPTQLIRSLTLKANGSDVLDSMTGQIAHRLSLMRRGQLPPLTAPTGFAIASYPVSLAILLDRLNIDGIRPKDSAFPTRGLQTFQLELQMGAATDLLTGAPTATITGGIVEVFGVQIAEEPSPIDGSYSLPLYLQRRIETTIPFAASNANYQQRIAAGARLRGILFRAYGVTAGEPSDAVINNIKVMIGNQVALDLSYLSLRALNVGDYDVTTMPVGYCFVDFMNVGGPYSKIADALDLRAMPDISLYLDVTGGANVNVSILPIEFADYNPRQFGLAG